MIFDFVINLLKNLFLYVIDLLPVFDLDISFFNSFGSLTVWFNVVYYLIPSSVFNILLLILSYQAFKLTYKVIAKVVSLVSMSGF